ncbi:MAG: hypothetical protein AAF823_01045 [Planctomycetota bacterium]
MLSTEGCSAEEIAQVLDYSPRQIRRIRRKIREERAISFDPKHTSEFVGEVVAELRAVAQRSRRAVRGSRATNHEKLRAERNVQHAVMSMLRALQTTGYVNQVSASTAENHETFRDMVSRLFYQQITSEKCRTAQFHRRITAMKAELEAEGLDLSQLSQELETEMVGDLDE